MYSLRAIHSPHYPLILAASLTEWTYAKISFSLHIETHSPVALSWEQTVHLRISTVRNVLQYGVNLLLTLIIC
jgi:hypothetical protein